MPSDSSDAQGMSIVSKADRFLTALAEHGPQSVAALARLLDEPVSSIYRLIGNLERIGWVEKGDERGVIRLGLRIVGIAQSVEDTLDIRRLALPELMQLRGRTGESALLCVRRESRAVCIERVAGGEVQSSELPLGGSMVLHRGAAPLAILAFEGDGFRRQYLDRVIADAVNPLTEYDQRRLASTIATVRESGFAVSDGDVTPGGLSVAAPIFDHRGIVVGSLGISGLSALIRAADYEPSDLVTDAAHRVSESLGYRKGGAPR